MLKELKAFALRGNLLELATAFIIGAAFATLVQSLVTNVLMPLISAVAGESSFDRFDFTIGDTDIEYGTFLTALVNFLLIALALFVIIRAVTKLERPALSDQPVKMRECPQCLSLIPDGARRCSACTSEVDATA